MPYAVDSLRYLGLDTLSERVLRRLTDRWTGELYPADSLPAPTEGVISDENFEVIVERWREAREQYHDAPLEQVMGESSSLAEGVRVVGEQADVMGDQLSEVALTTSWWDLPELIEPLYGVLIVAAVFFYGFCLYRYYDDIVALFSSVFGERILNSSRKGERLRSDIFYGSLGKLFMLGVGFVGLIAGVVCLRMGLALPDSVTFYMPLTAMAAFLVVVALQYVMLGVVGFVTSSLDGVASLMRIRLVYFVLATLIVAPVLLVSMMGQSAGYDLWFKAALVAAGVVSVLFIRESIKFFIHKKVSILHWILYLCTVEILPLTLLWQVVDRVR
ncbi:MAG: DUF4271 domain-containing protein [Alistipes sp.]|nr:DUF4271 domain-containing protein [Alistipes sp.]